MSKPCIICVAITGSLPRKANNPAVPITIAEQVESAQAAVEAGASIVHAHVRNDDETPTSDPERFGRLLEGLRGHCPRHDRPVLHRRPIRRRAGARRHAVAAPRHGLACRSDRTTSRPGSTRTARTWSTGWPPRCWPTA